MNTMDDLRNLLTEHADHTGAVPQIADDAVHLGRRARVRRRAAAVATAVITAGVVVTVPLALTGGGDSVAPAGPGETARPDEAASTGPAWVSSLPGLDLPAGEPLDAPYALGNTIIDGDTEFTVDAVITQFIAVDGGYLVLSDDTTGPAGGMPASGRLDFVSTDGAETPIDTGRIKRIAVDRAADSGNPVVAWDWQDSDTGDSDAGALKVMQLGKDSAPQVQPIEMSTSVRWVVDGDPVFAYQFEDSSWQVARWDVQSGEVAPWLPEPLGTDPSIKDFTPDGEVGFFFDNDSQCDSAIDLGEPETVLWEACADPGYFTSVSPDGRVLAGQAGAANALTGDRLVDFDLPDQGDIGRDDYVPVSLLGWETPATVLFQAYGLQVLEGNDEAYTTALGPGSYVVVRCAIAGGQCETVPHPVDVLAE